MVLIIGGKVQLVCPNNISSFYDQFNEFKEIASQFLAEPKKTIGPPGLLYVNQREFAVITPEDNIQIIGSEDATTCIIVILQHKNRGVIALTHLDGSKTEGAIHTIFKKLFAIVGGQFQDGLLLHMFGGYSDPQGHSFRLFKSIMTSIHMLPVHVHLGICCIGEMNTVQRHGIPSPILYGVGIDSKTGSIFPATFPNKGPEEVLRGARALCGDSEILDVYNNFSRELEIGPFQFRDIAAAYILQQEDEFILKNLSTSPDVEPPDFVSKIRDQLKFILLNPYPELTVFPNNKPLYYKMDTRNGPWFAVTH